jgi:hypothetical protein
MSIEGKDKGKRGDGKTRQRAGEFAITVVQNLG